jgi:hypothetical protein
MTFNERAARSVNNIRIIFSMDITTPNVQWVNLGAGVWYMRMDAIYPDVEEELLGWFTPQFFRDIGSVLVDSIELVQATSVLEVSENPESFYWDGEALYIYPPGGTSPYMHEILLGIVFGYSREGFSPVNANTFYESRLLALPSISKARDPLYWGRLQYEGGSVDLNNGDGEFDLFGESVDVYGNQARVMMGFADMDIAEYQRLFTGFVETMDIDETKNTVSFKDKRKQLTKPITYACTALNALEAIEEILLDNYNIPYNGLYFNQSLWEAAKSRAYNVTIDMQDEEPAIDVIQGICESTFGVFVTDPDGRYSFRITQLGDPAEYEIPSHDIINYPRAIYDPSEVITSVRVGYDRNWTLTGASAYTYYTDTSREAEIFGRYKTYNQRTFDTMLPTLTDAQNFASTILDYAEVIRPSIEIEVPIKYYMVDVGDFVQVEINRPRATWFGERKCEVIRKVYNLERNTISLTVKKYGDEISYRITTDDFMRATTSDDIRKVGA